MRTAAQIFEQDFGSFSDLSDVSLIEQKIKNIQIESLTFAKDLIQKFNPDNEKQWNEGHYARYFAAGEILTEIRKLKLSGNY